MATAEMLIAEIDGRVDHINTHVSLGASHEEVSNEQYRALIATIVQLNGIELDVVTAVSKHLQSTTV